MRMRMRKRKREGEGEGEGEGEEGGKGEADKKGRIQTLVGFDSIRVLFCPLVQPKCFSEVLHIILMKRKESRLRGGRRGESESRAQGAWSREERGEKMESN